MNSVLSKAIAVLMSLLLLAYVGYQSFVALYDPYQTEMVNIGTYITDVDIEGFFLRDEEVLDIAKQGVISYNYKNSQKISRGAAVAGVYQSENDLYNLRQLESLKTEKAILIEAQSKDSIKGLKLDLLNSQIATSKAQLREQVDNSDFTHIESVYNDLLLNVNKIAVCIDNSITYDDTIASIDAKIASIEAKLPTETAPITTEASGYFSNTIDGYEKDFTFDLLDDMTVEKAEQLMTKKPATVPNNIGKIVYENYWYFVSVVSKSDAEELVKPFNKNETVKLKFNSKSTREIEATIESISIEKAAEKAIVVFKSFYLDEDLINLRFETPKAIISSYDGVIIPKEAIRIQDDVKNEETGEITDKVKGVYTMLGKNVRFKRVDVLYEDDYILISKQSNSSDYVSIYDQVIIKGRNMDTGG